MSIYQINYTIYPIVIIISILSTILAFKTELYKKHYISFIYIIGIFIITVSTLFMDKITDNWVNYFLICIFIIQIITCGMLIYHIIYRFKKI